MARKRNQNSEIEKIAYTPEEVAVLLDIDLPMVESLIRQKVFRSVRVGSVWRISRRSFLSWFEGETDETEQEASTESSGRSLNSQKEADGILKTESELPLETEIVTESFTGERESVQSAEADTVLKDEKVQKMTDESGEDDLSDLTGLLDSEAGRELIRLLAKDL